MRESALRQCHFEWRESRLLPGFGGSQERLGSLTTIRVGQLASPHASERLTCEGAVSGQAGGDGPHDERQHGREEGVTEGTSVNRVVEDGQERDREAARSEQRDEPSPA